MRSSMAMPSRRRKAPATLEQLLAAVFSGFMLFFAGLVALALMFQLIYIGRIFPGVSVAGIEVGSLTPEEAADQISSRLTYPQQGVLTLQDGSKTWGVSPLQLGLVIDPQGLARNAFQLGRSKNIFSRLSDQFAAFTSGRNVAPYLVLDERMTQRYLTNLAAEINQPVIEPRLTIQGTEVVIQQGQIGRMVDVPATLAALQTQVKTLSNGTVPLVIDETRPVVEDVSAQADLARQILSAPLTLRMPDGQANAPGPWEISPEKMAPMLMFAPQSENGVTKYEIVLNRVMLYAYLSELAPTIQVSSQNARFIFNDDTRLLEPIQASIVGRKLNIEKSAERMLTDLIAGKHDITLELDLEDPEINDQMTGEQLGITELVHAETSYFYGSSAERVQNITAAASRFHGLLIAPGETFSMANAMGDISLDNGYAEALIILGGQTIKGVGGGVCQVSTTLFRAAFFGGYPINERHAHAYRVYYYEKVAGNRVDPNLAGLDATVFVPLVDFKFTNDTPNWLLMETYVNPSSASITWKFYSTRDNRRVEWSNTGPVNVVEAPKTLYRENSDLPSGEVKQVDWAADGADVTVNRTVYRNDSVYLQDVFKTHYEPWQAIYEYGPGTEGMPPTDEENQGE